MSAFETYINRFNFNEYGGSLADAHDDIVGAQMHAAELFNAIMDSDAAGRGQEGQQIYSIARAGQAMLASIQPQMAAVAAFLDRAEREDLIAALAENAESIDTPKAPGASPPPFNPEAAAEFVARKPVAWDTPTGGLGATIDRIINSEKTGLGAISERLMREGGLDGHA